MILFIENKISLKYALYKNYLRIFSIGKCIICGTYTENADIQYHFNSKF